MKRRFIRDPMRVGARIPRTEHGTLGTEPCTCEQGLARLSTVWERLKREPPTEPNVIFGPLTHEETVQMNLRHAELHLSFLKPRQ